MNVWIFQGNPKKFKIDEYLKTRKYILWTIRQKFFAEEIMIGDIVYIWRSDGNIPKTGGIVARGKVVSNPQNIEDDTPELWIDCQERKKVALRVRIELEDIRLSEKDGMLKRVDLKKDPIVSDMRILKFPSNTNYKLTSLHAKHIEKLWLFAKR